MSTTKYRFQRQWPRAEITAVEVDRETEHCIFVTDARGRVRKELKNNSYDETHDSWQEAHAALSAKVADKLMWANERAREAEALLQEVAAMREPT